MQIPDFSKSRVIVVGDVMLDRYWHGQTERISPEAPVPVLKVNSHEERPGGAGNVAYNLKALGCQVSLLACIGADENGERLNNIFKSAKIDTFFQTLADKPTITKLRALSKHQQLLRLDFEDDFFDFDQALLLNDFSNQLKQADAVIISDYGKGTISNAKAFIELARKQKVPVLVDPKGHSFEKYDGATLLTPNMREFEMVVGPCKTEDEICDKALTAISSNNLDGVLVTRGPQGMTLIGKNKKTPELHLPAKVREVFDVTGAGDTVIATLAAGLACKLPTADAVTLANIAAGIVVKRLGAATVTQLELFQTLQNSGHAGTGSLTREQLSLVLKDARSKKQKIVFTNGCFDILHAGHVRYLQQAKELGDRLIVGVNDDASVERLKGVGRPVNPLERRTAVLSALSMVDWVVPFSEDTPAEIIAEIIPDVLVKGGDYKPDELAGADTVKANGGEVKILDFVDGCSTSNVISQIIKGDLS